LIEFAVPQKMGLQILANKFKRLLNISPDYKCSVNPNAHDLSKMDWASGTHPINCVLSSPRKINLEQKDNAK